MPLTNKSLLDTTRRPRKGNRLYCMVWAEDDLFKVGLGSGKNRRDSSATATIRKYLGPKGRAPGPVREWRWEVPALNNKAWGDCQRLEMVFATALNVGWGLLRRGPSDLSGSSSKDSSSSRGRRSWRPLRWMP